MGYQTTLAELMLSGNTTWPQFMQDHFSCKAPSTPVETVAAELSKQLDLIASSGYSRHEQVKALERIIRANLTDRRFDL